MAPDSVTTVPRCTIAGTLPMGFTARKLAFFCSWFSRFTTSKRYGAPTSSSIQCTMRPRDIGLLYNTTSSLMCRLLDDDCRAVDPRAACYAHGAVAVALLPATGSERRTGPARVWSVKGSRV